MVALGREHLWFDAKDIGRKKWQFFYAPPVFDTPIIYFWWGCQKVKKFDDTFRHNIWMWETEAVTAWGLRLGIASRSEKWQFTWDIISLTLLFNCRYDEDKDFKGRGRFSCICRTPKGSIRKVCGLAAVCSTFCRCILVWFSDSTYVCLCPWYTVLSCYLFIFTRINLTNTKKYESSLRGILNVYYFKFFLKIRFWYLRCCGCPWNRGRQHLATPLKTCHNTEAGFLTGWLLCLSPNSEVTASETPPFPHLGCVPAVVPAKGGSSA